MDYDKLIEMKPNCIECHHIHPDNGNCTAVGGFCTAVPAARCPLIPELRADLARVTAERDAAVNALKKWNICATCGHYSPHGKKSNCRIKSAHISGGNWAGCSEWEWRGIKED